MFTKILIDNRGDRTEVAVAPATNCPVRAAHAGEFTPMEFSRV